MYIKFTNICYGEYKCSCCNNVLNGSTTVIAHESDDDGLYWRQFCNNCIQLLQNKTNKQLYKTYKVSELNE